jgi:hypothetical protein
MSTPPVVTCVACEPMEPPEGAAEVVALQPSAIVDHVCLLSPEAVSCLVGGQANVGGSRRCSPEELKALLSGVPVKLEGRTPAARGVLPFSHGIRDL